MGSLISKQLLKRAIDRDDGDTVYELLLKNKGLLKKEVRSDTVYYGMFAYAIRSGNVHACEKMISIIQNDPEYVHMLNSPLGLHMCYGDATPLIYVTECGIATCTDIAKLIIDAGADVNDECWDKTPLIAAARCGDLETVKVLVAAGADVQKATFSEHDGKRTPISASLDHVSQNTVQIIRFLVESGSSLNDARLGWDNDTLLTLAIRNDKSHLSYREVVTCLVELGAKVNQPSSGREISVGSGPTGETPLTIAVHNKYDDDKQNLEMVKLLCELGADVNLKAPSGTRPLNAAMHRLIYGAKEYFKVVTSMDIADVLMKAGANTYGDGNMVQDMVKEFSALYEVFHGDYSEDHQEDHMRQLKVFRKGWAERETAMFHSDFQDMQDRQRAEEEAEYKRTYHECRECGTMCSEPGTVWCSQSCIDRAMDR